tara:strand:+ start:215 stop:1201 length:987 start_codon:yes stop_codon:yes gene_type:complete
MQKIRLLITIFFTIVVGTSHGLAKDASNLSENQIYSEVIKLLDKHRDDNYDIWGKRKVSKAQELFNRTYGKNDSKSADEIFNELYSTEISRADARLERIINVKPKSLKSLNRIKNRADRFEEAKAILSSPNQLKALELFIKLANDGDPEAFYYLGRAYRHGIGLAKNESLGFDLYQISAELGGVTARDLLLIDIMWTYIGEDDFQRSLNLSRLLIKNGNDEGIYHLGYHYFKGYGVMKNHKEALKLFRQIINDGNAQRHVGDIYAEGKGVLQSNIHAHMWYNIGSSNNNFGSDRDRDAIALKMSPTDVAKAQAMARVCVKSAYKNCDW